MEEGDIRRRRRVSEAEREEREEREIEDGQFDAEPAKVAGAQRTSSRPDSHDHLALSGPLKV